MESVTISAPPMGDPIDEERFPTDPWMLIDRDPAPRDLGATESVFTVSNGYLGLRGNVEEGREAHSHGTFVNGFHETWPIQHAEEAFGFAKTGQSIVNAPDSKTLRIYVDDEPLLLGEADTEDYERVLDFREGVLRRNFMWRTASGKRIGVQTSRLVSMHDRHLAMFTVEVTPLDGDAAITISSLVLNRQDGEDEYHVPAAALGEGMDPRRADSFGRRVLIPQGHQGTEDGTSYLSYRCSNSGMTIAVGVSHEIACADAFTTTHRVDPDRACFDVSVAASTGGTVRVTKTAAYHTSRGVPARELIDRCERTLSRVRDDGEAAVLARQRAWFDEFWDCADVQVGTEEGRLQQVIRWNLFQLAQATGRADGGGIPAKGLSGNGYSGHYFWDTEIYVVPFLTYTSPQRARSALRFRSTMLPIARQRARELSQRGAWFPWRTINGEEASAYYAAGTAGYHVSADIAYAVDQYGTATEDTDFLSGDGLDILVETARAFEDLGFWRDDPSALAFHIHGVTGPDEYTTVVDDNLFTNVMARQTMASAASRLESLRDRDPIAFDSAVARLGIQPEEITAWRRASDAMAVPFDEALGIHPQDAQFLGREVWDFASTPAERRPLLLHFHPLVIYRFQVLKQADVVMAMFLQGDQFTLEQKRANFDYYDPLTTRDSTLSASTQSIVAAEIGNEPLAIKYFWEAALVDLHNTHGNTWHGLHVASMGGVWAALTRGFGGFRDRQGVFSIDPRLPSDWEFLQFEVTIRGHHFRVRVTHSSVELRSRQDSAAPLNLVVFGREVVLHSGQVVTVDRK